MKRVRPYCSLGNVPAKNRVKIYGENVFYHAYNRGYGKQDLFRDNHDYRTLLYLLRKYLEVGFQERKYTPKGEEYFVEPNHVYTDVDLVAYCLMPNHFHLLLYQKTLMGMPMLVARLCTNYATYFNQKYGTEGSPFQGTYKAVGVKNENQLLHLSRYIHANPWELSTEINLEEYPYSSYKYCFGSERPKWLQLEWVKNSFSRSEDYRSFVNDYRQAKVERREKELELIKSLIIEDF